MEDIEEQRVSFEDLVKQDNSEEGNVLNSEFDKRANLFWDDLLGIIEILNKANPSRAINETTSPIITDYLLWRILSELKLMNSRDK